MLATFRLPEEPLQRRAWYLALAGLVPFVFLALLLLVFGRENPLTSPVAEVFRAYSIVILSFLGGIRWGYSLAPADEETRPEPGWSLLLSVVPSLAGWVLFLPPVGLAIPLLLVAFCAQGAWDSFSAARGHLPAWFASLRIVLTIAVAACHLLAFAAY